MSKAAKVCSISARKVVGITNRFQGQLGGFLVEEVVKWLKVLAVLQVRAVVDADKKAKLEKPLKEAGLKPQEIADLLGKTYGAVAKAISRAK